MVSNRLRRLKLNKFNLFKVNDLQRARKYFYFYEQSKISALFPNPNLDSDKITTIFQLNNK